MTANSTTPRVMRITSVGLNDLNILNTAIVGPGSVSVMLAVVEEEICASTIAQKRIRVATINDQRSAIVQG